VYTQLEHNGTQIIPGINPYYHDQHHLRLHGNYGLTRFWDAVYGTCLLPLPMTR
jgi:sterol desaturase/sphingolipid hydroxylase (fatty acid hydroxylase superfamily)